MMIKVQLGLFLACILAVYDAKGQAPLVLDEKNSRSDPPGGCMVTNPEARGRSACTSPAAAYQSSDAQKTIAEARRRATSEQNEKPPYVPGECPSTPTRIRWIQYCRENHCTWAYVLVETRDCVHFRRCCKSYPFHWNCRCRTVIVTRKVSAVMPKWFGHHHRTCPVSDWCITDVLIRYKAGCRCSCYCKRYLPYAPPAPGHHG